MSHASDISLGQPGRACAGVRALPVLKRSMADVSSRTGATALTPKCSVMRWKSVLDASSSFSEQVLDFDLVVRARQTQPRGALRAPAARSRSACRAAISDSSCQSLGRLTTPPSRAPKTGCDTSSSNSRTFSHIDHRGAPTCPRPAHRTAPPRAAGPGASRNSRPRRRRSASAPPGGTVAVGAGQKVPELRVAERARR